VGRHTPTHEGAEIEVVKIAKKVRTHFYISNQANSILDDMVKEGKKIYKNGINRSVIIENLINKSDPLNTLQEKAKHLQVDLQATVDRIRILQHIKEKSKVSEPSYKKENEN